MKRFVLPLILLLALVLRVAWLDKYPIGFTPDEASFGYDAYSILKSGRDQWGHSLPLILESFGDFKSPLYTYLTIPSVAIFGLTKFAVRLPNAILGTLAVLVVYLLAKKLFSAKQQAPLDGEKIAFFSSFLLAISPWHIMLSRGAFEANLTTFFLPLGVYLFLKEKFWLAGLVLGLNLFSYHSAKFVTPLVFIALIVYTKKNVKKYWPALASFGVFLLLTFYTLTLGGGARVTERSITAGALEEAFEERVRSTALFHNKYQVTLKRFFGNYVTYVSPQFFFSEGPKEGTYGMIPGHGVLYWFVIPFFLGVRKLFYQGKYRKELLFLAFWVFISPIPAALASGVGYSANRVAVMMPALEILLGVGALAVYEFIKNRKVILYGFTVLVLVSISLFLEDYFVQSPYKIARPMLYGNLEAANWISNNLPKDSQIIIDKSLSEPHIYFAFSEKVDPATYQKATKDWNYSTWVDQQPQYSLGRFTFKDLKPDDLISGNILVGRSEDFSSGTVPSYVIYYPDGKPSIFVVEEVK